LAHQQKGLDKTDRSIEQLKLQAEKSVGISEKLKSNLELKALQAVKAVKIVKLTQTREFFSDVKRRYTQHLKNTYIEENMKERNKGSVESEWLNTKGDFLKKRDEKYRERKQQQQQREENRVQLKLRNIQERRLEVDTRVIMRKNNGKIRSPRLEI